MIKYTGGDLEEGQYEGDRSHQGVTSSRGRRRSHEHQHRASRVMETSKRKQNMAWEIGGRRRGDGGGTQGRFSIRQQRGCRQAAARDRERLGHQSQTGT